jgi:hypothetical protein
MLSSFVLRTLAGAVRKQVVSGVGLPMSGRGTPRPYKPWRLWRAFAWGLAVAILFQANHWVEIFHRFQNSDFVTAAGDLIGRLDLLPVIFVLAAVARNAIMKRRRAKA